MNNLSFRKLSFFTPNFADQNANSKTPPTTKHLSSKIRLTITVRNVHPRVWISLDITRRMPFLAEKTIKKFLTRAVQLYEQEQGERFCSPSLGLYVRRWGRWVGSAASNELTLPESISKTFFLPLGPRRRLNPDPPCGVARQTNNGGVNISPLQWH